MTAKTEVVAFSNRILAGIGLEVLKSKSERAFIESTEAKLVIDVGANVGQYGRALRQAGYSGEIWSFEPVSHVYAALEAQAKHDPKWRTFQAAIGAVEGSATIHVAKHTVYSSLKTTTSSAAAFDAASEVAHDEVVAVRRLTDVLKNDQREFFLKVDTQGFEQEVLAGAEGVLHRCVGLQLELPIEHLYEGVWTFIEALTLLDQAGFVLAQARPVSFSVAYPASAIEFDFIFRRRT